MFTSQRVSEHRGGDDLLTAASASTACARWRRRRSPIPRIRPPTELRRRAIWSNWRGIADLAPGGGYGSAVRQHAGGARARVLRVRDGAGANAAASRAGAGARCASIAASAAWWSTASSGSRGIYGAIAVAGAWGLPKGCAVAYTDKGAGTDYSTSMPVGPTALGRGERLAFVPDASRSGVLQARAFAGQPGGRLGPPREAGGGIRAAGARRGVPDAGAVHLRQHARDRGRHLQRRRRGAARGGTAKATGWTPWSPASRTSTSKAAAPLYDYTTEAALLMPCALLRLVARSLPQSPMRRQVARVGGIALRIAARRRACCRATMRRRRRRRAHDKLHANGWTDAAMRAGALSVDFDLWRAVAVTYASAYGRYGVGEHPCGYGFSAQNTDFTPRAATAGRTAAWWSDASGIPPGAGVGHHRSRKLAAPDSALPGVQCLRALWDGQGADAERVRAGVAAVRAQAPRKGLPVLVVHGARRRPGAAGVHQRAVCGDGEGRRRATCATGRCATRSISTASWRCPDYGARYVPLLPYVYAALDRVSAPSRRSARRCRPMR